MHKITDQTLPLNRLTYRAARFPKATVGILSHNISLKRQKRSDLRNKLEIIDIRVRHLICGTYSMQGYIPLVIFRQIPDLVRINSGLTETLCYRAQNSLFAQTVTAKTFIARKIDI